MAQYPGSGLPGYPENVLQLNSAGTSWGGNALPWYRSTHTIDPNTGALQGVPGPVPAGVAMAYQAAHEQGVWNQQQSLLRSATGYGEGALGALQSFRPGGGAAMAAGAYGNLANIQLQRAQLTQPMDLLADWRRNEDFEARRRAQNARMLGLVGQLGGAVLQAVGMIAGGGGAAAAPLAMGQAGQMLNQQLQGSMRPQQGQQIQTGQGQETTQQQQLQPNTQQQGPPAPVSGGASNIPAEQLPQWAQGGAAGGYRTGGGFGGGGALQSRIGPSGGMGGPGGGMEQPMGGPGMRPPAGAMGSFDPNSYAVASTQDPSPAAAVVDRMVSQYVAWQVSSDPSWDMLNLGISSELALRQAQYMVGSA